MGHPTLHDVMAMGREATRTSGTISPHGKLEEPRADEERCYARLAGWIDGTMEERGIKGKLSA